MSDHLTFLDVNAAAGELNQLFTFDVTTAIGQCDACGKTTPLAECYVYAMQPGMVVRCNRCENVLVRVASNPRGTWLDLRGLRHLTFAHRCSSY